MTQLNQLVMELGRRFLVPALEMPEAGRQTLTINDYHKVVIERSLAEGEFFLYGLVAEVPTEKQLSIYRAALQGQLFGKYTSTACLALDEKNHTLVLFEKFVEKGLSPQDFYERFVTFCSTLEFWIDRIHSPLSDMEEEIDLKQHTEGLSDHRMRIVLT